MKRKEEEVVVKVYCNSMSDSRVLEALDWLEEHEVKYVLRAFTQEDFKLKDFYKILELGYGGMEYLISKKSDAMATYNKYNQLNDMRLSEAYYCFLNNPHMFDSPIMLDNRGRSAKLNKGYEELTVYLSREARRLTPEEMKLAETVIAPEDEPLELDFEF